MTDEARLLLAVCMVQLEKTRPYCRVDQTNEGDSLVYIEESASLLVVEFSIEVWGGSMFPVKIL